MRRHSLDEEVKHILCQGSSSLSRGLNAGPPEYEEKFGLPVFDNYFENNLFFLPYTDFSVPGSSDSIVILGSLKSM